MKTLFAAVTLTIALVVTGIRVDAQSGEDLFQKALAVERADGNLRQAIQLYERVVKDFRADRALVARALMRIAECYETLGQREAADVYQRIVREFADQAGSAAAARARLAALQVQKPNGPVPTLRQVWGAGSDPMGSPSEDGRYLSFTDWETGDLALRDLREGTNRRLTSSGGWELSGDFAEYSVVSPDGRQVAYAWFKDKTNQPKGPCVCRYDLRVVSVSEATAAKPRVLFDSEDTFWIRPVAWTPDGRSLVVIREALDRTGDISLFPVAGGSPRVVKSFRWPGPDAATISPDGRLLTYAAPSVENGQTHDIHIVSIDGNGDRVLVGGSSHDTAPLWMPDGRGLLFLSNRTGTDSLWRVPIDGGSLSGTPTLVRDNLGTSVFPIGITRAGSYLYTFGGPIGNVYMADVDTAISKIATPALVTSRFLNSNQAPSWSPDGERLAYLSRRGSAETPRSLALIIRTVATGDEHEVPLKVSAVDRVSWFPDGRSVLVAARDVQQPRFAYYRVDIASGNADLLHYTVGLGGQTARRPLVSPNGKSLYYVERDNPFANTTRLMRLDLDTRAVAELNRTSSNDVYFTSFSLSPDGSEIAYLLFDGAARATRLEVMPAAGGPSRRIVANAMGGDGTRYSGIAWTPDKQFLLFARAESSVANPPTALWKVPAQGGLPEKTAIAVDGMLRHVDVDPGGRRLAFAVQTPGAREIWALENFLPQAVTR